MSELQQGSKQKEDEHCKLHKNPHRHLAVVGAITEQCKQ